MQPAPAPWRARPLPRRAAVLLPFLLLGATACAIPAAPRPPMPVAAPEAFSEAGAEAAPARWWRAFDDPRLDGLVDRALEGNLDLRSLWLRLAEARAVARREAAPLRPEVDGFVDAEAATVDGEDDSRFGLGLAAAYEVDLWGRIRRGVEAERLRADATRADYRAGALSLAAEVATIHYRLDEARLQVALLDEQIASNEQIRELIEARVASQQLSGVDLLRQRELIEATEEQRILAVRRRNLLENELAVLLGEAPGRRGLQSGEAAAATLPALPPAPTTGVPIELVRRRPDLERAELLVAAADRDLAVAIRDCYPRLELTASLSTLESGSADIFRTWLASFAAGLLAPLFDGGRRRAETDRTLAVRDRLLIDYGQAVLIAFREVEDALVLEATSRERTASLEKQAALAEETTSRLRTSYFNGVDDYIDVLTALTDKQRLERELLTSRRELIEARIALYRALAGGFETPRERPVE